MRGAWCATYIIRMPQISTATTGSCFLCEVSTIPDSEGWGISLEKVSKGAIKWLLDSR